MCIIESGLLLSPDRKIIFGVFGTDDQNVCIPKTVETILPLAFHSKHKVVSFQEDSVITGFNPKAFGDDCLIERLILPAGFRDVTSISQCIRKVEFEIGNAHMDSVDNFIISTDNRVLEKYYGLSKEITIPLYVI